MTSSYVIPLNTPYTTLDMVGGKGMSLAKMASAGFAVPDGFCLSTAVYKQFVDANDLQAQIVTLAAPAIVKGVVSFEAASIAIQALFDAPIPEDIVTEATAAFAGLNDEHGIAARCVPRPRLKICQACHSPGSRIPTLMCVVKTRSSRQ